MTAESVNRNTLTPRPSEPAVCRDCGKPAVKKRWFWYALAVIAELVWHGPDPRTPFCKDCRHASTALMLVVGIMLLPLAYVIYLKSR